MGTGLILAEFGLSVLGVLKAAIPTDQTSEVTMLATLANFPVIFVSGIFIPVENPPEWGRLVAYASPLTYLVKATKYGLGTGERSGI
ncbi:ABC transporter permease [Natronococcus jeotgali]|uniref:Antibiotic transport system permease protein n=1 Tax=Natronococcus jeotgali DSM 18795 TaxID=1227498 RepID=L9XC46_9EURY|nr:ABC transporter permease [Natronococcus jeotgali]ELY59310.1 antibiotic transport system permease protein [Natronococcus jeotgali DSM 18795]